MTEKVDKSGHLKAFKWTPKRSLFVELMPACEFNATKSAEKAGFSKKTARKIGNNLMQIPQIKNKVDKALDKALWKAGVTTERILKEYQVVGFMDIPDFLTLKGDGSIKLKPFSRMKDGQSRAIAGITEDTWITKGKGGDALLHRKVTYKFHDKLRALEALGKFKQMFIQRIDLSGELDLVPKFNLEDLRESFELINGRKPSPRKDKTEPIPEL